MATRILKRAALAATAGGLTLLGLSLQAAAAPLGGPGLARPLEPTARHARLADGIVQVRRRYSHGSGQGHWGGGQGHWGGNGHHGHWGGGNGHHGHWGGGNGHHGHWGGGGYYGGNWGHHHGHNNGGYYYGGLGLYGGGFGYGYGGFYGGVPYYADPYAYAPAYEEPYDYAPAYGGGGGYGAHVRWCLNRYRSYDPGSDTFAGYDGYRHQCLAPY